MRRRTLSVLDPLYGRVELPGFLEPFLLSPEFARLGSVRLLNFQSLELAALSEARRRSHTLGVLHLGSRLTLLGFGDDEIKALLLTAVLHDVGTPPFGHTLEYEFARRTGINHEQIVSRILDGSHNPLGLDHQIYGGRSPRLGALVRESGLNETVRLILDGAHPLSTYLFGDLDLDNLDNVYRMNWYLGVRCDPGNAQRLASLINVDQAGRKILDEKHRPLVQDWLSLRARAYHHLLDSKMHRQNQSVFSRIVQEAMLEKPGGRAVIDEDDWFETDERLIAILRDVDIFKPFFADLDRSEPLWELTISFESEQSIPRAKLMKHRDAIAEQLASVIDRPIYVTLLAVGETLERRIQFVDGRTGRAWAAGDPRLTYRLHINIGGSAKGDGMANAGRVVSMKVKDYAYEQGWIAEPGTQPATAERDLLEL